LPDRPVVEMRDRPCTGIDRRIAHRFRRKHLVAAVIHGKRRAQPVAKRALDKTHLRPTGGAKCAFCLGGLPAAQARWRKHNVGSGAREAAQARQSHWGGRVPQIAKRAREPGANAVMPRLLKAVQTPKLRA
jgi:hypothetical protein